MRRELARNCTLLVSPANTILTEPDIYDRNLYVVATGQVRISIPDHPDEDQRRGFLLGEQGVFWGTLNGQWATRTGYWP